jgi:hypothetical protein
MSENTKICPYCAETIKAKAKLCRYCGQQLESKEEARVAEHTIKEIKETISKNQKPKASDNKNLRLWILRFLLVFLLVCSLLILGKYGSTLEQEVVEISSETPRPTATRKPTLTPYPLAPSAQEIFDSVKNMTDAQRNKYMESLENSRVEDWQGTVRDVDESEIFGGFSIEVDTQSNNNDRIPEIQIEVSEDVALSVNKGDKIAFSGVIKGLSDLIEVIIFIEDAVIEVFE